jgi:MFS family permease
MSDEAISDQEKAPSVSWRSAIGLNAGNFFLAEVTGVTLPFVAAYLKDLYFSPFTIGLALTLAGLGVFLMQSPAGFIADRVKQRRLLLAGASVLLGVCYALVPVVPASSFAIDPLLFLSGVGQAFFLPLLGALALGLAGHKGLNRMMGHNQSWNHAGNLAAALSALALVYLFSSTVPVFYAVFAVSVLAGASVFLIRPKEVNEELASGGKAKDDKPVRFTDLLRDRRVVVLIAATALFHLANAPVMPLVAQYVKDMDKGEAAKEGDLQVSLVVLVAQAVMIPVALLTGWLVDRWGRKPILAIGFVVLPVRIALYALAGSPAMLIALQTLDGVGAGIYGVAIVAVCADLTRGKGGFNALSGVIATALAVGGVIGPISVGVLTQYLGYKAAFGVFAGIAAVAAVLYIGFMPETKDAKAA